MQFVNAPTKVEEIWKKKWDSLLITEKRWRAWSERRESCAGQIVISVALKRSFKGCHGLSQAHIKSQQQLFWVWALSLPQILSKYFSSLSKHMVLLEEPEAKQWQMIFSCHQSCGRAVRRLPSLNNTPHIRGLMYTEIQPVFGMINDQCLLSDFCIYISWTWR